MDLGQHTETLRYLLRDRAGQFTAAFDAVLTAADITVLKTRAGCPQANPYAETFALTARAELTDRIPILGEHHLPHMLTEYTRHNNQRRPHRGRHPQPPRPNQPIPAPQHNKSAVTLASAAQSTTTSQQHKHPPHSAAALLAPDRLRGTVTWMRPMGCDSPGGCRCGGDVEVPFRSAAVELPRPGDLLLPV